MNFNILPHILVWEPLTPMMEMQSSMDAPL